MGSEAVVFKAYVQTNSCSFQLLERSGTNARISMHTKNKINLCLECVWISRVFFGLLLTRSYIFFKKGKNETKNKNIRLRIPTSIILPRKKKKVVLKAAYFVISEHSTTCKENSLHTILKLNTECPSQVYFYIAKVCEIELNFIYKTLSSFKILL